MFTHLILVPRIRKVDVLYRRCIPTYLSCLYELRKKTELYELAQDLVDRMNADAVTWYAVGTYYMCIQHYNEAKQYFK
jgi:anaphase-promoting complex subunit 6